jgi:CheY-like chemotaxis protein
MSYALVIDDEQAILDLVTMMLESMGWTVASTTNGSDAIRRAEKEPPAFVITDLVMPEMEGIDFMRRLGKILPHTPIIVMSGNPIGIQFLQSARLFGAKATLNKPFSMTELQAAVRSVVPDPE